MSRQLILYSDTMLHCRAPARLVEILPMAAEERDSVYPIWTTDDRHVYSLERRIRCDRASFRMLNDVFARDRSTVFWCHGPLREADAESFEIVSTHRDDEVGVYRSYAKDKGNVFFYSGMGKPR